MAWTLQGVIGSQLGDVTSTIVVEGQTMTVRDYIQVCCFLVGHGRAIRVRDGYIVAVHWSWGNPSGVVSIARDYGQEHRGGQRGTVGLYRGFLTMRAHVVQGTYAFEYDGLWYCVIVLLGFCIVFWLVVAGESCLSSSRQSESLLLGLCCCVPHRSV